MKIRKGKTEITLGPKAQRDMANAIIEALEVVVSVTGLGNASDQFAEIINNLRKIEQDRAKRVFEAFCENELPDDVDLDNPNYDDQAAAILIGQRRKRLHTAIKTDLDYRSIGAFIEIVNQENVRATQAVRAHKRHEESRARKQQVFHWCDENMNRFTSMDEAALDIAEAFVPEKFRTVRDWMTEWRKLRRTGTP